MTAPDSADNRSFPRRDKDRSFRLPVRARVRAAQRLFVRAARGRFERSAARAFLGQLGALDFVNSVVLFGASLLLSVLPFIILLSSLANHRIDTDLSLDIGLLRGRPHRRSAVPVLARPFRCPDTDRPDRCCRWHHGRGGLPAGNLRADLRPAASRLARRPPLPHLGRSLVRGPGHREHHQ